jgi:hypothetical protein
MDEFDEYQPAPSYKSKTSDSQEWYDAGYPTWPMLDDDISVDPEDQYDPDSSEVDYPDTPSQSSSSSDPSEDTSAPFRYMGKQYSPTTSETFVAPRRRRIIPANARTSDPPHPRPSSAPATISGPWKKPRTQNLHRPNNKSPSSEQMDISASLAPAGSRDPDQMDWEPDRMEVPVPRTGSPEPSGIQTPNSLPDLIPPSPRSRPWSEYVPSPPNYPSFPSYPVPSSR